MRWRVLAISALCAALSVGALHGLIRTEQDRLGAAVREGALHTPLAAALFLLLLPVLWGLNQKRLDALSQWIAREDRARWVRAFALVLPGALTVWVASVARLGTLFMTAFHHVGLAAMAQSVTLMGVTLAAITAVLLLTAVLARRITWSLRRALIMGVLIAAAVVLVGLLTGDVHGRGGMFGSFGVLRKPELDLAPVWTLVAAVALTLLFVRALLERPRLQWACGIAAILLTVFSMRETALRYELSPAGAVIEGRAGLSRVVLRMLRRSTDRDHDHASRFFGGGDCDDNDARRSPDAREIAGNGIDEDCSGQDAPVVQRRAVQRPSNVAQTAAQAPRVPVKNLLLITVDTLRWDLHYAGNPRPISPNLDALAARSVVLDRAYAMSSYTARSIGPLMTGRYPTECPRDRQHFVRYPDRGNTFLAERLRAAGFHTGAVASHFYFERRYGNMQGIEQLDLNAERNGEAVEAESTDAAVADRAIALLQNESFTQGRFFLWIHFFDPHKQYVLHPEIAPFARNERGKYDAEVAWTDRQIGRVLAAVSAHAWAGETMVVATADHGEAFAEHGLSWHGVELWEELVRVPWIVSVPGLSARHITQPRSHIDLVPTVLDALGLPIPAPDAADFVSGESLLGEFQGTVTPAPRDIYCELPEGPFNGTRRALIADGYKLLFRGGRQFELYNLESDPGEHHNNAAAEPAQLLAMRNRMEQLRATLREVAEHE
jgi:arylsulfatase A-like enzyme